MSERGVGEVEKGAEAEINLRVIMCACSERRRKYPVYPAREVSVYHGGNVPGLEVFSSAYIATESGSCGALDI